MSALMLGDHWAKKVNCYVSECRRLISSQGWQRRHLLLKQTWFLAQCVEAFPNDFLDLSPSLLKLEPSSDQGQHVFRTSVVVLFVQ